MINMDSFFIPPSDQLQIKITSIKKWNYSNRGSSISIKKRLKQKNYKVKEAGPNSSKKIADLSTF